MSSNLNLSLIAAFALSVAGSSAARAQPDSSDASGSQSTDSQTKKKKQKKHPPLTKLEKLERGNPNSVYYKSRKKHAPNSSSAEINAAETANPASVDYGKDPAEVLKEE